MEKPGRRVTIPTVAGAIVVVTTWLVAELGSIDIPAGVESALTVIVMAVLTYVIHDTLPSKGGDDESPDQ